MFGESVLERLLEMLLAGSVEQFKIALIDLDKNYSILNESSFYNGSP